jgi:hypothetical protein
MFNVLKILFIKIVLYQFYILIIFAYNKDDFIDYFCIFVFDPEWDFKES